MGKLQQLIGKTVEKDFQERMAKLGWWVHRFSNSIGGQPCDYVLVKADQVWFVDVKNVQNSNVMGFGRLEENQKNAFKLLKVLGGYYRMGWVLRFEDDYYLLSYGDFLVLSEQQKRQVVQKKELLPFWYFINENIPNE
jgi:hypothetical protein